MTSPQQHADYLLFIWQQNKHLPPPLRLASVDVSKPPRLIVVGDHDAELERSAA